MSKKKQLSAEEVFDACFDNGLDIWEAAKVVNDLWGREVFIVGEPVKGAYKNLDVEEFMLQHRKLMEKLGDK